MKNRFQFFLLIIICIFVFLPKDSYAAIVRYPKYITYNVNVDYCFDGSLNTSYKLYD